MLAHTTFISCRLLVMVVKSNLVISIAEARKLLGSEAIHMADDEIEKLINDFDIIAQYTIKLVQKFHNNDNKTD